MASILKVDGKWRAQVRRKGHKSIAQAFDSKADAEKWARKVEREMDDSTFKDARSLSAVKLETLIDRYTKEIGSVKEFGRSKVAAIACLRRMLGNEPISKLTSDRLLRFVKERMAGGAGGVTIGVELSYLGSIYKAARMLWKMPIDSEPIASARGNMHYLGISTKSSERDRRPTDAELARLCAHFDGKPRQRVPMSDIIQFAVSTAMRAGEIIDLKWSDLNEKDKTILIRDRKHPTEKKGNDQEVPLLNDAFDIVMRQKRTSDRIFPVRDGTISTIFPRACNALGIVDLHFHDLRHEGVSRLFEQGYRIEQVALVSGHRDWKMLARYTQIKAKDLHKKPS